MKSGDADLFSRLDDIDGKLDHIRGNLNVLAHISKHSSKPELIAMAWDVIGKSLPMQRMWLVMKDFTKQKDLAEAANVPPESIGKYLQRMHPRLVSKERKGKFVLYRRTDMFEGIGLEKRIKDEHKKANEDLPK